MKLVLCILVALALGKVGAQVYIRQKSIEDTVVQAYRQHAIAACGLHDAAEAKKAGGPFFDRNLAAPAPHVALAIGQPELDVRIWQTSNPAWATRFSDPFLVVTTRTDNITTTCSYDIRNAKVYDFKRLPDEEQARGQQVSEVAPVERRVRR
jgi:hypothetical protein